MGSTPGALPGWTAEGGCPLMTDFYAIHLHASSSTRIDCTRSIANIINFRLRRGGCVLDQLWRGDADCCLCVGDQRNTRAHNDDPDAYPDPHHQRIDVSFDDGTSC